MSRVDLPAVSVVVTTLNRLHYLRVALDSIEAQTFRQFEVIVLDDGSDDGTQEFLASYRPQFPIRLFEFDRRERSHLRNAGVSASRAPLVAFLDDDDVWHPEKLAKQFEVAASRPDIAFIYTFTIPVDEGNLANPSVDSRHLAMYREQVRRGHTYEALAETCLIFTSSVLVRKSVIEDVGGFDEELVGAEDWDFYLNVARKGSLAAVEEPLVRYRLHSGNSAAGGNAGSVGDARIRAAAKHLDIARKNGDRRLESLMLRAIAQNHFWAGRNRQSLASGLLALKASPRTFSTRDNIALMGRVAVKAVVRGG